MLERALPSPGGPGVPADDRLWRLVRRALTLASLALAAWLLGAVLGSQHASAGPATPGQHTAPTRPTAPASRALPGLVARTAHGVGRLLEASPSAASARPSTPALSTVTDTSAALTSTVRDAVHTAGSALAPPVVAATVDGAVTGTVGMVDRTTGSLIAALDPVLATVPGVGTAPRGESGHPAPTGAAVPARASAPAPVSAASGRPAGRTTTRHHAAPAAAARITSAADRAPSYLGGGSAVAPSAPAVTASWSRSLPTLPFAPPGPHLPPAPPAPAAGGPSGSAAADQAVVAVTHRARPPHLGRVVMAEVTIACAADADDPSFSPD